MNLIKDLRDRLIAVESATIHLAQKLTWLADWRGWPPPKDLRYTPPDESGRNPVTEQLREDQRNKDPAIHLAWWSEFDRYHLLERAFRAAIQSAMAAATRAASVLDTPDTPPLRRDSTLIKYTLGRLGQAVPTPAPHGPYPPVQDYSADLLAVELNAIADWANRLGVASTESASVSPASSKDATVIPRSNAPDLSAVKELYQEVVAMSPGACVKASLIYKRLGRSRQSMKNHENPESSVSANRDNLDIIKRDERDGKFYSRESVLRWLSARSLHLSDEDLKLAKAFADLEERAARESKAM